MSAMAKALFFLLLAVPAVYGENYVVGGTQGWNTGVDYTAWASDKTFKTGDSLVFNYDNSHQVDEVNKNDYNDCSSANVLNSHVGTTATIKLSKPGTLYFICPTAGHCSSGMKLQVDVKEASTPSSSSPTSSPGTTTPASTTKTPPPHSGAASVADNLMKLAGGSVVFATLLLHYMS